MEGFDGKAFDSDVFKARIGDFIMPKKGEVKQVIGYAIGRDGRPCYVVDYGSDDRGWQTYLEPVEKVTEKWEKVEL